MYKHSRRLWREREREKNLIYSRLFIRCRSELGLPAMKSSIERRTMLTWLSEHKCVWWTLCRSWTRYLYLTIWFLIVSWIPCARPTVIIDRPSHAAYGICPIDDDKLFNGSIRYGWKTSSSQEQRKSLVVLFGGGMQMRGDRIVVYLQMTMMDQHLEV